MAKSTTTRQGVSLTCKSPIIWTIKVLQLLSIIWHPIMQNTTKLHLLDTILTSRDSMTSQPPHLSQWTTLGCRVRLWNLYSINMRIIKRLREWIRELTKVCQSSKLQGGKSLNKDLPRWIRFKTSSRPKSSAVLQAWTTLRKRITISQQM